MNFHILLQPWEQLQNPGSLPKPWEQFQNPESSHPSLLYSSSLRRTPPLPVKTYPFAVFLPFTYLPSCLIRLSIISAVFLSSLSSSAFSFSLICRPTGPETNDQSRWIIGRIIHSKECIDTELLLNTFRALSVHD